MPNHSSSTSPNLTAASRTRDLGSPTRTHLAVEGLSLAYPDRRVLSDISFTARPGDRIGLIGENGTGKSSLLGLIAAASTGEDRGAAAPPAGRGSLVSGTIALPGSVALLAQRLPYPGDAPLSRVLDDAQRDAVEALARIETLGAELAQHPADERTAEAYAEALEAAERTGAWRAEAERGDALAGLGLGGIAPERPVGTLSGGQQLRLALAAVLLRAPFVLLLDEPSNHLDDASAAYLERVLRGWPGIVIFASHDRALLDSVATSILDLDPLPMPARELADASRASEPEATGSSDDSGAGFGVRLWGVGYTAARTERSAEMRRWRERYEAEFEEREALEHEIEVGSREVNRKHESKSEAKITRKFYADKDARVTARRARNARVRLEQLERERVRRPPEPLRFRGFEERPFAAHDPAPLLRADRVSLAARLAETSLEVRAGDRLLLTGPNGAGKSTLLSILAGQLQPDTGTVERPARVGFLPQEVEFAEPRRSAADAYRLALGEEVSELLPLDATGLLAPRDLDRAVEDLSIGQRRRLALAVLAADSPPLLLLDEPSNHLSLTLVEELEEALRHYPGALVIASHDRWLRSRWTGGVLDLGALRG